jgi:hypothetical protein
MHGVAEPLSRTAGSFGDIATSWKDLAKILHRR